MKPCLYRLLALPLLVLAASSCVKTLVVLPDSEDWDIVLNAAFNTDEGNQTVFLSRAAGMETAPLKGARVTCRVGGMSYIAAEEEDDEAYRQYYAASYVLHMPTLSPGDEITVTAECEGKRASATVTVPIPGDITQFRALPLLKNIWFTARLTDPGEGEDYFQLEGWWEREWQEEQEDGETATHLYRDPIWLNVRGDAVLSEGRPSGDGDSIVDDVLDGLYGDDRVLFSDSRFSSGKASVRFSTELDEFYTGSGEKPRRAFFRLTTYTPEHYRYMKAVSASDILDTPELLMFIEPVSIPVNVSGGLGFVSACSWKEISVEL